MNDRKKLEWKLMPTYYHSAPLLLEVDAIIRPGNWGRILNCYTQNTGNPWMLAREFVFESVRLAEFSNLPSRLSCAFVFDNLEHANIHKHNFSPWNLLYEVELVSPETPKHRAGFNLFNFPETELKFVPFSIDMARKYWRGEEIEVAEVLTVSSLRVKTIIDIDN